MKMNRFSVLMSVYAKENPFFLTASLTSIVSQTCMPGKVIIVKDGQIPLQLQAVLDRFSSQYPELFYITGYTDNRGLGVALEFGLHFANTDYVFRMDADDISVPERFEKQINFLDQHPEVDVLGSNISEFKDDPSKPVRIRCVPENHQAIYEKGKLQNPVNHMTVAFRTEKVRAAGSYRNAPFFEDYDLWVRMLRSGMIFHNLQQPLVLARVGNDMVGKRHGWNYFKVELDHFKKMRAIGFISAAEYAKAILLRLPLRLIPKGILSAFYNFALRKKI